MGLILKTKEFIRLNPSLLLLITVYGILLPNLLSYEHSWVQPEQFYIKMGILQNGSNLSLQDLKNTFNWQLFEYQPRCTRPLSSFFEIIDTKFRCWLWNYIPPHPSLSLTWIFSLILAPFFLFKLLKNLSISTNLALCLIAFYLVTPGVLSYEVMLFRPAKPMTNFSIILSLFLASQLNKKFINNHQRIPLLKFYVFWIFTVSSIFWDETAFLMILTVPFFSPKIFKRLLFIISWISIPFIIYIGYFHIIPLCSKLSGHLMPQLNNYDKLQNLNFLNGLFDSFQYLSSNLKSLFFDTMGIWSYSNSQSSLLSLSSLFPWGILMLYALKGRFIFYYPLLSLVFLVLFFNFSMYACQMLTWGPYYYGVYWSIFFIICIAFYLEKFQVPKTILLLCFLIIILNTSYVFITTNKIYKKCHYYPYNPGEIEEYFKYKLNRFSLNEQPFLNGDKIKSIIFTYWKDSQEGKKKQYSLPKELCWLPLEVKPNIQHSRYTLLQTNNQDYINAQ